VVLARVPADPHPGLTAVLVAIARELSSRRPLEDVRLHTVSVLVELDPTNGLPSTVTLRTECQRDVYPRR